MSVSGKRPSDNPKQDDPEQSKRFIKLAQEQGGKASEKDLANAVKKLAKSERTTPKD